MFVKVLHSTLADDIFVTLETTTAAGSFPAFHAHNAYEIYILTSGSRNIFIGNNLYTVTAGDASMVRAQIPHRSYGKTPYSGICIEFTGAYLTAHFGLAQRQQILACFQKDVISIGENSLALLWRSATETTRGAFDKKEFLVLAAQILSAERLSADVCDKRSHDSDLSHIGAYIQENYRAIKGLDGLTERFGISKSYLCRMFKRQTGITVVEYINRLRIQHAYKLLQETDLSVATISRQVGFDTVIYFNRVFKKMLGETPLQARKSAREKWTYLT